jgi:hypothetical protein
MKWISVDDRLPKTTRHGLEHYCNKDILLRVQGGYKVVGNYYAHDNAMQGFEWVQSSCGTFDDLNRKVTHWCEIEEPKVI